MSCSVNHKEVLNINNLLGNYNCKTMPDYTKVGGRSGRNGQYFIEVNSDTVDPYKNLSSHCDSLSKSNLKNKTDSDLCEQVESTLPSIIGLSNKTLSKKVLNKVDRSKKVNRKSSFHESLQRIEGTDVLFNHYQKHWFSSSIERLKLEDKSREERLEITRYELQRHLRQLAKTNLGNSNEYLKDISTLDLDLRYRVHPKSVRDRGYGTLVPQCKCDTNDCENVALPCTRYCTVHIMHCPDQVLFDHCTAKFSDNTQCSLPVFDVTHQLPLCTEHARKNHDYQLHQEAKPKKIRKKIKLNSSVRLQKRTKKTKKKVIRIEDCQPEALNGKRQELASTSTKVILPPEEDADGLELVSVEQALVTPTSNLLEESEINNVLSTIQASEFDDFFTVVNRNGDYEPTHEETEELERALAAVDNDVKSLEKLSQSQGLLDSFLDEHTLVESLVQIPDVFHNGYASCGDSIVANSRLLSVEPHSHS